MKRKLLLIMLIIFVSIFTAKTQTCAHSVELRDSYGDGWNGGTLTITVNGSAVLTNITIADGAGPEVYYFDAATGDDIDADYTAGSWSSENEYIVKDGGGSVLGQSGQGGITPVDILNMVGNCPACPPPTGQTETNITTTTADLGWTTGGATTWDIEWGPENFVQGTGTTITGTNSNPYPLTGLTAATPYDWYVRDDCGGDVSDWTGPHTFTSACDAITTFPYTENFDGTWVGTPAAPQCWTVINANSDSYFWSRANTYITPTHSPLYAAHGMGNTNDYLITPQLDLTGLNTRILWWDKVESATRINSYRVLVSTTTPEIASFTDDLGIYNCANTAWTEHLLDLSAYNGQTIYVAFYQFASAATNYGFGIDDVTFEEIPACPAPTALATTNITTTTADLGWTENGISNTWNIEWKAGSDFTPGTGASDGSTTVSPTPSHSLSSLTDGTTYYWYVQADCGGDVSSWTGPVAFNTLPANDLCANAEVVTCGSSVDGTTLGATFDNVGTCGTINTAPGVWYKLEVDGSFKDFTVSTCDAADFDTKISVFSGDCDNLVCVGGNDDGLGCSGYTSELTVTTDLFQPKTYYILVHGFSTNQGNFNLSVTCTEPYPVPLSNWAIYLGIFLIGTFMVFHFVRRRLA